MQTACHRSQQLGQPPSQPLRLTACQHGLHGLPARQSARPAVLRVRFSACAAAGLRSLPQRQTGGAAALSAASRHRNTSVSLSEASQPEPARLQRRCAAPGRSRRRLGVQRRRRSSCCPGPRPCHPAPSRRAAAATACRHDLAAGRLRAIAGAASRDQAPRQPRESIGHA